MGAVGEMAVNAEVSNPEIDSDEVAGMDATGGEPAEEDAMADGDVDLGTPANN